MTDLALQALLDKQEIAELLRLLRVITLMSVFTPRMRGVKTLNKWSCDGSDPWCAHPSAVPPHVQVRAQAGQA